MRIAVVGSYGVGMTMYVEAAPLAGETIRATGLVYGPGGKGSNQAIAARRLGAEVALCSIVGPDEFGNQALRLWAEEGVDASGVLTGQAPTMVGFILVEQSGENRIAIAPGALEELSAEHVRGFAPRLSAADLVVTNLEIPVPAAGAALQAARDAGVRTVLNPAPATSEAAPILALADHLTPNRTEAATLAGCDPDAPTDDLLGALRKLAPDAWITLTMGGDGVIVDAPPGGASLPARTPVPAIAVAPERIVDTAGAGDAFSAAYAVALAAGHTPLDAARLGVLAGAFAVTRREVVPGLATWQELSELAASVGLAAPRL
jgi:ribokinase